MRKFAAVAAALVLPVVVLTGTAQGKGRGKYWGAAFSSKTHRTGCEVRVDRRRRLYVTCAQQVPTKPGHYGERIPYMTLRRHGRATKRISGLANLEVSAAILRYGRWIWPGKMTPPTTDRHPQRVPRRAFHGTRHQLRCIIRFTGLTCKNADQHGFTVAVGRSKRF